MRLLMLSSRKLQYLVFFGAERVDSPCYEIGKRWIIFFYNFHNLVDAKLHECCFLFETVYSETNMLVYVLVVKLSEVVQGHQLRLPELTVM